MTPPSDPPPSGSPWKTPAVHLTGPLRTERLILRLFASSDLEAVYDMQSRPEVARYLYWSPRDRDAAAESLREKLNCTSIEAEGDILNLAVVRAGGGPAIGDLMLHYESASHRQAEIGYSSILKSRARAGDRGGGASSTWPSVSSGPTGSSGRSMPGTPRRPECSSAWACGAKPTWWRTSGSRESGPTR